MKMWFESNCCNCKTPNLIDNGFCSDLTVADIEGFVCWKCKANNAFDDEGATVPSQEEQIDDGYPVPQSPDPEKAFAAIT